MGNHPNRGAVPTGASKPKPGEIRQFRDVHGLTAAQAGALVHVSADAWMRWEDGTRPMHPAFLELAGLKVEPYPNPGVEA